MLSFLRLHPALRPTTLRHLSSSTSASSSTNTNSNSLLPLKLKILSTSTPYIPVTGWGSQSLISSCLHLNLSPALHSIVLDSDSVTPFSGEGKSMLINYHMARCNFKLKEFITSSSSNSVNKSMKHRLLLNSVYVKSGRWSEAMAVGALPINLLTTKGFLECSVDLICFSGEDQGSIGIGEVIVEDVGVSVFPDDEGNVRSSTGRVDEHKYKPSLIYRTRVSMIYTLVELHMLTDASEDYSDTWEYMDSLLSGSSLLSEGNTTDTSGREGSLTSNELAFATITSLHSLATGIASVLPKPSHEVVLGFMSGVRSPMEGIVKGIVNMAISNQNAGGGQGQGQGQGGAKYNDSPNYNGGDGQSEKTEKEKEKERKADFDAAKLFP